jgi:Flp pilus assembly protein protease CpaA
MVETLILISAFIYLILASINDIKYRFVHDYPSYSFGLLFLILRIILAFELNNFTILLEMLYYAIPTLLISLVLYKLGAWGGGDLKLLTALSIGIYSFSTDTYLSFYLNFLMNTMIMGLVFSLLWSLILIFKNIKKVSKKITKTDLFIIVIFFLIGFYFIFQSTLFKIFSVLLFLIPLTYLTKKVEYDIQVIDKKVKDLEEGDWIIKDIKVGRKLIIKKPTGLSKQDIKVLQNSRLRKIKIKDGIPFVPSFLLALIATIIYDNLIFSLITNI